MTRAFAVGRRALDGFRRQLVRLVGRADALRDVAPGVVHLQEVAAAAARAAPAARGATRRRRSSATSPAVDLEHHGRPAVVGEILVVHLVERREPARAMAAGHDRGRAVGARAVLQIDVRGDREHRIRDAVVPRHALGPGHVRPGVAVPRAALELGRVAPRRVRDHVAVLAEQRLDDRAGSPGCVTAAWHAALRLSIS